jgi:hypothetical protein
VGLRRRRQVAAKIETTEGTFNTPAAVDAGILVYDPTIAYEVPMFERTPARASLSTLQKLPGIRTGTLTMRVELRGSGTAATPPSWGVLLKGSGMRELTTVTLPGTSTASMEHGTTVTQATSNATGVIYKDHTHPFTTIRIAVTSGTFVNTEVIDDDFSAATFTPSSGPSTEGISYWPNSAGGEGNNTSLSIDLREDGRSKRLRGSRGTFTIEATVGEPAFLNFEIRGVEELVSDIALLSGVIFEEVTPPKFQGVGFAISTGTPYSALITNFTLAMNNTLANRLSANEAEGIQAVRISNRGPGGSFDPEAVLVATHDFFNNWFNGTVYTAGWTIGSGAGNTIEFFAPRAQTDTVGDGDRDGIATDPVDFSVHAGNVNSPSDDEFVIYHK